MHNAKREFPAWLLFLIILFLGTLFMLGAGQFAIRLAPRWNLIADVDSNINPNDQLVKWNDSARIEPVSAAILTQPAWRATYLTPGASVFVPPIVQGIPASTSEVNNTPLPAATVEPGSSVTPAQPTAGTSSTPAIIIFPSNTAAPNTAVPTKAPPSIPTVTPTSTGTATVTATSTVFVPTHTATSTGTATVTPTFPASTATPTATATPTGTSTATAASVTETPTATATETETATSVPSCARTVYLSGDGSVTVLKEMTCFSYTNSAYGKGAVFNISTSDADGNVLDPGGACSLNHLNPSKPVSYGVAKGSGDVMTFRVNVNTAGTLTITIGEWTSSTCP